MSRRNGIGLKVILTVACGGFILYGFYTFHDLHTRLKRSEEKADHLHQQHDSLSAQLQVVYEHKGRLEKSLQKEKGEHKKTKEDLTNDKDNSEKRFASEKKELLMRINSINKEYKLLKNQNDDLQVEYARMQDEQGKDLEDHKRLDAQRNEEYQSMKQDKDNEIAQLKDNVADLMRRNTELQHKAETALTNNARNQNQVEVDKQHILHLQEQILNLQRHRNGNPQQNLAPNQQMQQPNQQMQHPDVHQQMAGQHPQDNQAGAQVNQGLYQGGHLGGNQMPDVKVILPQFQNIQKRFQKQQSNVIAAMAGNEAQNQDQVNYQNQKMKEHIRENYPQRNDAQESEVQQMQINKPADPMAYVQPKDPKEGQGHIAEHDGHGEMHDHGQNDQGIVHQVRPPNINADENENEHNNDQNNAREEIKENEEHAAGLGADQIEENARVVGVHQPDRDQNVDQVVAPRAEDLQKPDQVNEQIAQPRLQEEINLNRDEGQIQGLGHRGRGEAHIKGPVGVEPHNQVAKPFENEMGKKDSQLLQDGQHDIDNDNKDKEEEEDDQFEEDQEDDNDAHNNQANDAA